jgi:hypothetical protein
MLLISRAAAARITVCIFIYYILGSPRDHLTSNAQPKKIVPAGCKLPDGLEAQQKSGPTKWAASGILHRKSAASSMSPMGLGRVKTPWQKH